MFVLLRNMSLLWSAVHVLILFVFLYRSRYSKRKTVILTLCTMLPLLVLNMTILYLTGPQTLAQVMVLTLTLPSLVFFYIMSADKGFRFLFTFCVTDTFSMWWISLSGLIDFLTGQTGWVMLILRFIGFPVAELFVYRYLSKPYRELQNNVKSGWGVFSLITVMYYALLIVASSFPVIIYERPESMLTYSLILILLPLIYAAIFVTLQNQLSLLHSREREEMLLIQKNQLEIQMENQAAIRKINHNMKAHINTISSLIAEKNYEQAQLYIGNISEFNSEYEKYCDNTYVNATLSYFMLQFKMAGISLYIDAFECFEDIKPYSEVCLILSNALDNALEATSALAKPDKSTSVQIKRKGVYLLIRVRNDCDESVCVKEGTVPESNKTEDGHGIGLPTIIESAKMLGGNAVCYAENGTFTLDVYIKANPD